MSKQIYATCEEAFEAQKQAIHAKCLDGCGMRRPALGADPQSCGADVCPLWRFSPIAQVATLAPQTPPPAFLTPEAGKEAFDDL